MANVLACLVLALSGFVATAQIEHGRQLTESVDDLETEKQCVGTDGVYWNLNYQQFLHHLLGSIHNSMVDVIDTNATFKEEVLGHDEGDIIGGACQWKCVHDVFNASAIVIWGTQLLLPKHRAYAPDLVENMLSGSVKACYPRLKYDDVRGIAGKVIEGMNNPDSQIPKDITISKQCPHAGAHPDSAAEMTYLEAKFKEAMAKAVEGDPRIKQYFTELFECQNTCFDIASSRMLINLWQAGFVNPDSDAEAELTSANKHVFVQGTTGAIRACYPHFPRSEVLAFATAVYEDLGKDPLASVIGEEEKYARTPRVDLPRNTIAMSIFGAFFGGAAVVFIAGLVVRRMRTGKPCSGASLQRNEGQEAPTTYASLLPSTEPEGVEFRDADV